MDFFREFRFWIPFTSSYLALLFCPTSDILIVVWTLIYLLLGYAWVSLKTELPHTDILFGVISFLLVVYRVSKDCAKNKKIALYSLILISLGTTWGGLRYYLVPSLVLSLFVTWISIVIWKQK